MITQRRFRNRILSTTEKMIAENKKRLTLFRKLRKFGPESIAISQLSNDKAISIKCRWKHPCRGSKLARDIAKSHGLKVKTTCRNGYLYVYRGNFLRALLSMLDENIRYLESVLEKINGNNKGA